MAVFIVLLDSSYSYFKKRIEGTKLTFNVGTLNYELECVNLENCEVVIPANQSEVINLNLTSLNKIDTKYELFYEVLSPIDTKNIIDGGHLLTDNLSDVGEIDKNITKNISLILNNTGNDEVTIKLGIAPSLKSDNAELKDTQVSLNKEGYQKYYVYDYEGKEGIFTAHTDGIYKLEVWGAQGGTYDDIYYGGYGGYSKGTVYLEKGTTLYTAVGSSGQLSTGSLVNGGYNGGGNGYSRSTTYYMSSGGGATHIAKEAGLLSTFSTKVDNVLLVAGGGGGSGYYSTQVGGSPGGSGGGIEGSSPINNCSDCGTTIGGSQTEGGTGRNGTGSFGTAYISTSYGCGGGGGYYGGSGDTHEWGATGGSGYIGNPDLIDKVMYCYNCKESDEVNTKTISTTNVSSSPISNYAKKGNGYAKITYLGTENYTLNFNSNGGKGTMTSQKVYKDEYALINKNTFTKDGYKFIGWSLEPNGEVIYEDSDKILNLAQLNEEVTLYAQYTIANYTITYNLNGGSVSDNPTSYNLETPTFTIQNPTRTDYTFAGWTGSNDLSSGLSSYTSSKPYTANSRDHFLGNDFAVEAGLTYRVFVTAKRTTGSLDLQGGIWYTELSSGNSYDGYGGAFTKLESVGNGYEKYYKDVIVPSGKTKGKFYVQINQETSGGTTSWDIYDMHVIRIDERINVSGLSQYTSSNTYTANSRDHAIGDDFSVETGTTYRVFVTAKRTAGSLDLQGGIRYTELSSGNAWDGYGGTFTKLETFDNGYEKYYKDVTVPNGKTKGKFYVQLEQETSGGTTTWSIYDMYVTKLGEEVSIAKGSTGDKTLTAQWIEKKYTVSLTKGTGISTVSGMGLYAPGESVTIKATLSSGYAFSKWTGDYTATAQTYTFTMPAKDVSLTATAISTRTYLYKSGDLCTNNSGGWSFVARSVDNYSASNASITYGDSYMTLYATKSGDMGDGSVYTKNAINLSGYSKLYAKISTSVSAGANGESDSSFMIFTSVMTSSTKPTWSHSANLDNYSSSTTVSIDVSDVTASRQIGFWIWTGKGNISVKIYEVWLEK